MTLSAPDWLAKRDGTLDRGSDGRTWFVLFDDQPNYRLRPVPAGGKFSCQVTQTNNGKRLDGGGVFANEDDAVRGGLEELRKALGW